MTAATCLRSQLAASVPCAQVCASDSHGGSEGLIAGRRSPDEFDAAALQAGEVPSAVLDVNGEM